MKTNNFLYKALSALFLFCCGLQAAWGQAKTGNYYDNESEINVESLRTVTARTVNGNRDAGNSYEGGYYVNIKNIFDGNTGTWWKSSRNGDVNIDFTFRSSQNIDIIHIYNGEQNQEKPNNVLVYSSTDGERWTLVQSFATNRNDSELRLYLDNTLTTRYLRLQLDPARDYGEGYRLAVNEIRFYYSFEVSRAVQHKDAKWFDLQRQLGLPNQSVGSFDHDINKFLPELSLSVDSIQAAHTYIDTIYMHKGASITLALPTKSESGAKGGSSSAQTYQRWYSYRTDGTFETNHIDGVYDLLTPNGATDVSRFTNGYVGRPLGSIAYAMDFYYPTNAEFEQWFPGSSVDNDWFVVACDVSGYTDFSEHFSSKGAGTDETRDDIVQACATQFEENDYYEPTIALRVIYYIVGVDDRDNDASESKKESWEGGHGRLLNEEYQDGGLNTSGKKYLEEYDITFPNVHLSNYTDELVALSKDAQSYAIPGAGRNENANLDIEMTSTDNLLQLITTELKKENRIIQFRKAGVGINTPWDVPDGTTATIYVTKTYNSKTYNIARFNLTFVADAIPLTQTQVSRLGTAGGSETWRNYSYRSPEWMDENLQKLTEQTFDFDPDVASGYGQNDYFHFPLAWDNSSYAFFDGSPWLDFASSANYDNKRWYPEFGYYAITNDYIGWGDQKSNNARPTPGPATGELLAKGASNYHIYVDASDRPGILARLPFEERLCEGSELYVTAWMKSGGSRDNADAAVLFTVLGVDGDGNETPIYRHSSSQIRTTTWLNEGDPGTGSGTNEWYQLYFSFINENEGAADYVSYVLQIENNSASTTGGDYYLDDIKVYLMQPTAAVTQKEYTCTNERTHMNIEMDWERLTSRLGVEGSDSLKGIDFCFIDETIYNTTYNEIIAANGGDDADANAVLAAKKAAVEAALVNVGDGKTIDTKILTLYFRKDFDKNFLYGDTIDGGDGKFAYEHYDAENQRAYFYRTGSESDAAGRRLTVDFYSVLSPNRPYLMLILPTENMGGGTTATVEDFAMQIGDPCNIQTRFYVASETLVKVNGEVVNPSTDFCQGQIFNFSAQLRYPTGVDNEGNQTFEIIEDGVYFDWFFGSEQEYIAANDDFGGISLSSALLDFRHFYPDATELSETGTPVTSEGEGKDFIEFSQDDYDIIAHYLNSGITEGGINSRLVLHRENLDITLLENGLELVVQPIQTLIAPDESGLSNEQWAQICWTYIPLVLTANDKAPQLHAGFNNVDYPAEDFAPDLRIGLAQIKKTQTTPLRIDLRGAQIVTEGATHLGIITTEDDRDNIYLIGSDDPEYADYFASADFNKYSLPIGKIKELYAEKYEQGSEYDDHMSITFNLDKQDNGFQFNPKEGHTYMFSAYFEEKSDRTGEIYNSCYGSFNVEMKVVPENLVWQGTEKDNWNNDSNWKRATADDLKIEDNSYTADDEAAGFVPMLFSNVIMPTYSKAQLYMAGYTEGGAAWTGSNNRPEGMGDPTENIQYDLMVYESNNSLTTQRYRVNICNDIHFMQGAQMLHAEQLIYQKAWMDVAVPTKKWTLVSTPLRDVYAGDWYTTTSGTQADEQYFTDIKFDNGKNNRLNPAVYQRSWDENATIVENSTTDTIGFNSSTPVWSAAYNDASVPYTAGGGFSIKAANAKGTGAVEGSLLFRLPKADTEYAYSTGDIERTENSGKLFISGLLDRSNPFALVRKDDVAAELVASQDGKYMIVGNPYMAPLDLQKFFDINTNLTGMYWTETEQGPGAGGSDGDGNNWLDPSETSTIAPYGAFFVEKKDSVGENTVKFTVDMQKFDTAESGTTTTGFTITAENEGGRSGAMLAYADNADNNYNAAEDVQLMRNLLGNNANELSVYTVAGDKAASVNRVKDLQQIPLGVFAADGDVTTLTFTGVEALLEPSLYDAEMNTDTPLTEGYTLTVDGASHGRYFIRAKGAGTTGITDAEVGGNDVSVYSMAAHQVTVSSGAELLEVSVYSVGGSLLKRESVGGGSTACTIYGVDSGVAIVRVVTADGTFTRKITVRR